MNETIQHVDQAIRSRHSMRNFLDKPVPQALVRELLELAACAPSSTNVQPWKVYALCGADKAALSAAVMARFEQGETDGREVDCYPKEWQEPWLSRRRA
ncbi:MAG: nitroreductase family protein, partial [Propionivibrio sp.]|nr:nitroreductase family protein [Propionivibrio sp.]